MLQRITTAALALMLVLGLSACSQVNQENYDLLQVGMDYSDATEILGDPDECSEKMQTRNCTWGDDDKHIKISFIAEKAMFITSEGLEP